MIDLAKEIEAVSKRYPEVSFAKLSRIAKRFFELGQNNKDIFSEEPDKSLENAAEEFVGFDMYTGNLREYRIGVAAFIAGAEWQKEKDTRDMYMSDNRHFQKVYELGKKDMKEQMMKEAVEGTVYGNGDYTWVAGDISSQFKYGDKVRIIVFKAEEESK